jgi:hypothetical protein
MTGKFDARGTCRRLLDAESEADVQAVIGSVPEMANLKNWRFLDIARRTLTSPPTRRPTAAKR